MTLYFWIILVVTFVFKASNQCDRGKVRLIGGSGPHEGRVEICDNSQWGRVCSNQWDDDDATVVCRQLGYSPRGATSSTGMEFGQGVGLRWFDNVECVPSINMELLDCHKVGAYVGSCHLYDAGVKCRDELRVEYVAAYIVNRTNTSTLYTVLVTWVQNLAVEEPTSFKVKCNNEQMLHSVIITVGNKKSRIQLGGFLSASYNCCVSAVYPLYEAKEVCTGINATNIRCTTCESVCTNLATVYIVVGVLGFIIAVLIILLVIASLSLLQPEFWKRLIPRRFSITAATSHCATSDTSTEVIGVTKGDESTANYCSLDTITLSTDSRRSDGKGEVLLSERHEFAGLPCHVESSIGVSTEENIFPGQVFEHEEYAHLKHLV